MPRPRTARRRTRAGSAVVALLAPVLVALTGCTYQAQEPGLFTQHDPQPSTGPSPESSPTSSLTQRRYPEPDGGGQLPVLGQRVWVSGEGLAIPVRIAVHAVRRFEGGTVLDWSVTPLATSEHRAGTEVPASLSLGLNRFDEGNTNIFLIDAARHRVYRPLTAISPNAQQHCLCAPLWVAQRQLRFGVTTVLQVAYPVLPADVGRVDVDVMTVPVFSQLPVTPIGEVPRPGISVDLSRAPDPVKPTVWTAPFPYPAPPGQKLRIGINQVLAGPNLTSIEWTVQTLTPGTAINSILEPPVVARDSTSAYDFADGYASGARIVAVNGRSHSPLAALSMTTELNGLGRQECLCTDMRLWSTGLQDAGGQVSVVTNVAVLPSYRRTVDINFPGLPTLHDVPITRAPDAAAASAGAVATPPKTWTYRANDPPIGWSIRDWPSPTPNDRQLSGYRSTIDTLG